jgi:tRNA threonylcarbamoyladenosine biosynthesis protein TsaE
VGDRIINPMQIAPLGFGLPDSLATEILGKSLAHAFPGAAMGGVVHLRGELGSGKTTCARSLLQALGVTGTVRSPTYTLVDTYKVGDLNCAHVDLYRLRSSTEVEELGLRDLTGPGFLMLIEWPEKGGVAVPPADIDLELRYEGEARAAQLTAASPIGQRWVSKLATDNSLIAYVSNLT